MKSQMIFAMTVCVLALAGCHNSKDRIPPEAQIDFPSRVGVTPESTITVRGKASDNVAVSSVTVNGVLADSTDNFETWSASIDLDAGANTISVDVVDHRGNKTTDAASVDITRRIEIEHPFGYEIDAATNTLYFVDLHNQKIMSVALASGDVAEFADISQFEPTGNTYRPPIDLALDLDNDRVFLGTRDVQTAGASSVGIWAYDTVAETWSAFSDSTIDTNAMLTNPSDLLLDTPNNRLLVLGFDVDAVVSVNLTTGAQTILSSNTVPNNTLGVMAEPIDAVIDRNSNRLLLVDRVADAVLGIDLTTGAKSLITGQGTGSGTNLNQPLSMDLDTANNRVLIYDRRTRAVEAVDLGTGARTRFSDNANFDDGRWLYDVRGLASSGGELIAFDNVMDHVLGIDLTTGERRIITNNGFPRGDNPPAFYSLEKVGSDFVGHAYLAIGKVGADNDVEILAGSFDDPNNMLEVSDLTVNAAGDTAYATSWVFVNNVWQQFIQTVNFSDGSTAVLSDATTPNTDNPLGVIADIVNDETNNRLIVLTTDKVLAVDRTSGVRSVLSDDATLPFVHSGELAHDVSNNRLLVADSAYDHLIAINLTDGTRSAFATTPVSGETDPEAPWHVACGDDGSVYMMDSQNRLLQVDGQTGERTMLIDVDALPISYDDYWSEIVVDDGLVYVRAYDGILEIDTESGEIVKVFATPESSPGNAT